ncbi:MAG: acylphosphatase [Parcubacteria group bacterium Gr01-1014_30]|nr:MAG: acylphosphatase [Parcubacteria group bacterium Gr01-1014_30]
MEKAKAHIFVSGSVQGVLFRDSARRKARKLKVKGWVRNLPDGRVEIIAEGEKDRVEQMINWARTGTILARVDNVDFEFEEYKGEFDDFEIRYAP